MPIYTKKGDKGKTSTLRGKMSKSDTLAETLGTIDELNSWLGYCRFEIKNMPDMEKELRRIQTNLMTINAILAGKQGLTIKPYEVKHLERLIDKWEAKLPKITNFIYPIGRLQVARTVARRAERMLVLLSEENTELFPNKMTRGLKKYLNRLSDTVFVMARTVNMVNGITEEIWKI